MNFFLSGVYIQVQYIGQTRKEKGKENRIDRLSEECLAVWGKHREDPFLHLLYIHCAVLYSEIVVSITRGM